MPVFTEQTILAEFQAIFFASTVIMFPSRVTVISENSLFVHSECLGASDLTRTV